MGKIDLKGKTALVTGASRGIGPVVAAGLAAEGVNLVLTARDLSRLMQVKERLAEYPVDVHVVAADLASAEGIARLHKEATAVAERIDILVSNAGMASMLPFHSVAPEELERELYVNQTAPFQLTRFLLPGMIERRDGHVVFVSSLAADVPMPFEALYCAGKAGLSIAARSLRLEYAGAGVRFSTILPGVIRGVGMAEDFARQTGIGFPWIMGGCTPRQVARAIVRALERDAIEVIVNRPPLRGTLALLRLWPSLWEGLAKRLLRPGAAEAARLNLEAGGRYTGVRPAAPPEDSPSDK